jgi:hypothetical protein
MNYLFLAACLLLFGLAVTLHRANGKILEDLGVRLPAVMIGVALISAVALGSLGGSKVRRRISLSEAGSAQR